MQDEPTPQELLGAVSAYLRNELMPAVAGAQSFHVRVAANAIDLALRQIRQEPGSRAAELARLQALQAQFPQGLETPAPLDDSQSGSAGAGSDVTGQSETLAVLNAALAQGVASGAIDGDDPALIDHLYATTLEKLAVDQPGYAAYRRAAGLDGVM